VALGAVGDVPGYRQLLQQRTLGKDRGGPRVAPGASLPPFPQGGLPVLQRVFNSTARLLAGVYGVWQIHVPEARGQRPAYVTLLWIPQSTTDGSVGRFKSAPILSSRPLGSSEPTNPKPGWDRRGKFRDRTIGVDRGQAGPSLT
jgi:hypothetical protein